MPTIVGISGTTEGFIEKKHLVSNVRILLQGLFGLHNSDPFHHEEGRGYVPHFQLIDDRDALDWRAKKRAVHVPLNDERQSEGDMSEGRVRPETIDY